MAALAVAAPRSPGELDLFAFDRGRRAAVARVGSAVAVDRVELTAVVAPSWVLSIPPPARTESLFTSSELFTVAVAAIVETATPIQAASRSSGPTWAEARGRSAGT